MCPTEFCPQFELPLNEILVQVELIFALIVTQFSDFTSNFPEYPELLREILFSPPRPHPELLAGDAGPHPWKM